MPIWKPSALRTNKISQAEDSAYDTQSGPIAAMNRAQRSASLAKGLARLAIITLTNLSKHVVRSDARHNRKIDEAGIAKCLEGQRPSAPPMLFRAAVYCFIGDLLAQDVEIGRLCDPLHEMLRLTNLRRPWYGDQIQISRKGPM